MELTEQLEVYVFPEQWKRGHIKFNQNQKLHQRLWLTKTHFMLSMTGWKSTLFRCIFFLTGRSSLWEHRILIYKGNILDAIAASGTNCYSCIMRIPSWVFEIWLHEQQSTLDWAECQQVIQNIGNLWKEFVLAYTLQTPGRTARWNEGETKS